MPRRAPYSRVRKIDQARPAHVRGKGDILYRGIECLAPECSNFFFVQDADFRDGFEFECPECFTVLRDGETTKFFEYELEQLATGRIIEAGEFRVDHRAYVEESGRFKYCLLCYALKPAHLFDVHRSRESGLQGECRLCKGAYNAIKNQSRTPDQHREAGQRRRLFQTLSADSFRIDTEAIFAKFGAACFRCDRPLDINERATYQLDHTLPVKFLWPMTTDDATLLCRDCNAYKRDRWPSEVYTRRQMRRLARLSGIKFEMLSGEPVINDSVVDAVLADPDGFIETMIEDAADRRNLQRVRELILDHRHVDLYDLASAVPAFLER